MKHCNIKQYENSVILEGFANKLCLAQTLDCGQAFRWNECSDGAFEGVAGGYYLKIAEIGEDIVLYDTDMNTFEGFWRNYLDIDRDYEALKNRLSTDSTMHNAIQYAPGIRVLRQDPWETLVSFIISSNNNIKRIKGIIERLCVLAGRCIDGKHYAFPTPQKLAELTENDLLPLKSGYRLKFIMDCAKKISEGSVNLDEVAALPTDKAQRILRQINGVGPKVADCVLLFGFARVESFPIDVWMKRVMDTLYPSGIPECFGNEAGIAQQYLFHYARHHSSLFEGLEPV